MTQSPVLSTQSPPDSDLEERLAAAIDPWLGHMTWRKDFAARPLATLCATTPGTDHPSVEESALEAAGLEGKRELCGLVRSPVAGGHMPRHTG